MWPTWWLDGKLWPKDMEVDVVEGNGTDSGGFNVHYACAQHPHGDCNLNGRGRRVAVRGATTGWHTYGADVEPSFVRFYYDGRLVGTYNGHVPAARRYLILGVTTAAHKLTRKATLGVDYVRTWSKK